MRFLSIPQIAQAVWNSVAVANRTVEVNTKTGFSLTAGSYSIRASSSQYAETNTTSTSATETVVISSVTTTRASINMATGHGSNSGSPGSSSWGVVNFASAAISWRRGNTDNSDFVVSNQVSEYF